MSKERANASRRGGIEKVRKVRKVDRREDADGLTPGVHMGYDLPDSELSNDELIGRLGDEYEIALRAGDHDRIENDIAPRFWSRFASYFNEYGREWKSPDPAREADYLLDEHSMGKVEMEWMDQVLKGEIEVGDEMDEEPSEY